MTSDRLEHPETTLVYDYPAGTVEFYTTDRRAFLRAVTRNPNYLKAEDLKPGYRLVYALENCRAPESALRPAEGGAQVVADRWLTETEKANRASASERLKKVRPES
jgi:hypothetical protein